MKNLPSGDLLGPFHGPLTNDDIEFIEEGFNELVCHLFEDEEERDEELAMDLPYKIEQYIGIADLVATDPDFKDIPGVNEMPAQMRELLKRVNEYFHRLN